MMAEEEPVMMESEQAPSSLAAEREGPVFGEETMGEEAASEEPALLSETAEAEPTGAAARPDGGAKGRAGRL